MFLFLDNYLSQSPNNFQLKKLIILFYLLSIILISLSSLLNRAFPINQYFVSEYVHGRFGWLITLSFIFMGAGGCLFLIALFKQLNSSVIGYLMISFLVIWTISTGLLSIFPADLRYTQITNNGQIHQFLAVITFTTALIINILGLIIDYNSKEILLISLSGLITLIVIAGMILLSFQDFNMQGFHQRMVVYPELVWFIVQSWYKIGKQV